jgi:hypothetical protein
MSDTGNVTVTIERAGGFTGIPVRRSISSSSLSPDQQEELRQLLDQSNFFSSSSSDSPASPDRFLYQITVATPAQANTVRFNEKDISEGVRALAEFVMKVGR